MVGPETAKEQLWKLRAAENMLNMSRAADKECSGLARGEKPSAMKHLCCGIILNCL
jgi:hypothetical protein